MMEHPNRPDVPVIPGKHETSTEETQALLIELKSIITRLQSQIDEVSHHLDISLSGTAGPASQSHITTLHSLKSSLQSELNDNLATLHALD